MSFIRHYTRDTIRSGLVRDPRWVRRAILSLDEQQHPDERGTGTARYRNNRGFSQSTAREGTRLAMMFRRGMPMTSADWAKARRIAWFHAVQLAKLANERSRSRAA